MFADGAAGLVVFVDHGEGFGEEALGDLLGHLGLGAGALFAGFVGDAFLAVEGPEEVYGGGAAGGEVGADLVEAGVEVGQGVEVGVAEAEVDAEGGGDADGGGAADDEAFDGVPGLFLVGDVDVGGFGGELGLVEEAEGGAGPLEGLEHGRRVVEKGQ